MAGIDMFPHVFLSLSGKNEDFVKQVKRHLPDGLAFFYPMSFQNGAHLLEAMEDGVHRSSVFVLFASKHSIESDWVRFEIDQARLEKIQRPNFKILVFPLSDDIELGKVPHWMRQYWIPKAGYTAKDIARYIRLTLTTPPIAPPALSTPVMGRGQLLDIATQRLMAHIADHQTNPSIYIFTGLSGIGRHTFARYFVKNALHSQPDLAMGPYFALPQFADIADIYRATREQVEANFTLSEFENDLLAFRKLSIDDQAAEVALSLSHFAKLGQAVFINFGSGLFEDRGDVKNWVWPLFSATSKIEGLSLCLVSSRQFSEDLITGHPTTIQFHVPSLRDPDVRALMTSTFTLYGAKPVSPSDALVKAIGGHAQIAKSTVRVLAQKGPLFFEKDPRILFNLQEEILSENLNVGALSVIQQEILCMLSWVPQLPGNLIEEVIQARHEVSTEQWLKELDNLLLGCLILPIESNLSISSAIRQLFRRKYGYGPEGLLKTFSKVLQNTWDESLEAGQFQSDIFDAFVFMHALEGKSLPGELKKLLLPSTLRDVVRDAYARGRDGDDKEALSKVVAWGSVADGMSMDETVREEILSTVIRAHVRMHESAKALNLLKDFKARGYRSTPFLFGFMLRKQGKYEEAIPYLREALAIKKFSRSAVQEIATCYQKLGMRRELHELVKLHRDLVETSASLLDFEIGALIAGGRFDDAEAAMRRLQSLPQDDGRSIARRAQIIIQRDHNFKKAEQLLSPLVEKNPDGPVYVRRFRAIAASYAKNFEVARQDIEYIRGRHGREETANRLQVHYFLAQSDFTAAEEAANKLKGSVHDQLLRARILEAKASDPKTPLSKREGLKIEALGLRARNNTGSEFDFD